MRQYLGGKSFDDVAIERLQEFEDSATERDPEGFFVAYSGGKDSVVVWDLAKRAGVKARAVHNLTTCDPPELVQFVKAQPDVAISPPPMSMWKLVRKKGMPPRRNARYCCEVLKEKGGTGSVVVTGIRWGESNRRSQRRMTEACYRDKAKRYLHPIIDWPTDAVWEYIRERELLYCSLYDEGFKRVGCVLCPMCHEVDRDLRRWPHLAQAWEHAVKATYPDDVDRFRFRSPQEYWEWWLDRRAPALADDSDPVLFEDAPELVEVGDG